jgi:hypothetical protein
MAGYSFREQADMTFTYGGYAARLYQETFPGQKQQNQQIFAAVYRRLAETGTLAAVSADLCGSVVARTPIWMSVS